MCTDACNPKGEKFVNFNDVRIFIRDVEDKEVIDIEVYWEGKFHLVDKGVPVYEFIKNLSWMDRQVNGTLSLNDCVLSRYQNEDGTFNFGNLERL